MWTRRRRRRVPISTVLLSCAAAVGVSVVVIGLLFGGATRAPEGPTSQPPESHTASAAVGEQATGAFESMDGGQIDLESYRGTPLVVNFFASWCTPCVTEMPDLEQVHQAFRSDVAFLGLAVRDTAEATQRLVDDTGVTYDIGRDPSGDLLVAFGGTSMPTTVVIDADGAVTSATTGALTAEELTRVIETDLET